MTANKETTEQTTQKRPDLLAETPAAQTAQEDPVLRFFIEHRFHITVVVIAVFAIYFLADLYQESRLASRRQTADYFVEMQESWSAWLAARDELNRLAGSQEAQPDSGAQAEANTKLETERSKLAAKIKELGAREVPYPEVAMLYDDLLAAEQLNYSEIKSRLEAVKWEQLQKDERKGLFAELRALVLARSLLDSAENQEIAWSAMANLARRGTYVHSAAGQTLALTAATPEQREDALSALEAVVSAHPEQEASLEDELLRLRM